MFGRISIQGQLNLILGLLLAIALGANIVGMILSAGPRTRAEADSVVRLSQEFIATAIASLQEARDPEPALRRLMVGLRDIRHVEITVEGDPDLAAPPPRADAERDVPAWFSRLAHPSVERASVDAIIHGQNFGRIVITSNPLDEIAEVWDAVKFAAIDDALLAAAVFLVTMWLISRSLTPIRRLSDALAQLRDGDYSVRLARTGPPEFTQISEKLNALASTLQNVTGANQRLVQKLIHVQDEERKEIARDLHDEMGPYLFAMRAATKSLMTQAKIPQANPARIAMACERLEEHAASLQQLNRTMLNRLRPTALRELGLEEALGALVAQVRTDHPELRISFSAPESFSDVDETTALTIYRIVQEGLTNVVKHARAKHVRIVISNERDWLRIRIEDDGSGLSADQVSGLGLLGMRERLQALDGNLDLRAGASGGTILEARLPRVRAATLA